MMPLSLRFAGQQGGGRTSLVGTGRPAFCRRGRAPVLAGLCATAVVIALMPALPAFAFIVYFPLCTSTVSHMWKHSVAV